MVKIFIKQCILHASELYFYYKYAVINLRRVSPEAPCLMTLAVYGLKHVQEIGRDIAANLSRKAFTFCHFAYRCTYLEILPVRWQSTTQLFYSTIHIIHIQYSCCTLAMAIIILRRIYTHWYFSMMRMVYYGVWFNSCSCNMQRALWYMDGEVKCI